jgi:molybdate transport system substrate-binding protein
MLVFPEGSMWISSSILLASLLGLPVSHPAAQAQETPTLRVLAAASLTEVVEQLGRRFEGARVVPSFGASSELARQIADGAPADVFVAASADWVEYLRQENALDGEPVVIAKNQLVAIAPKESPLAKQGAGDPRALLERLGPNDLVAIADAGVPAGEYARRALTKLGLLAAYEKRLVGQKDVRAVLRAVEQGELPAGFVYATDAKVAPVAQLFVFDPASHPPIEYHAAALRRAAQPAEARRFLGFLTSPIAREQLSNAGFALP